MRKGKNRGFTLLELMVVLAIIGGILIIAVPNLYHLLPGTELRASADELAAGLREARALAVAHNTAVTFELDGPDGRYAVGDGGTGGRLRPGLNISLVTARSEISGPGRGAIRFFPNGGSTGGRIELMKDGRKAVVEVDWLTGRISTAD